jgi:hypothetical protein
VKGKAHIRAAGKGRTFVAGSGEEVRLPALARLKREALDWLRAGSDAPSKRAAKLLAACDLDYEVAAGEGGALDALGVVAYADDETAWALSDDDDPVTDQVLAALFEACPEMRAFRAVTRG